MSREHVVNPLNRQNGVARVAVRIEDNRIVDATIATMSFRGFEILLKGRPAQDAVLFSQRICGICSTAHGIASSFALEDAYESAPPTNGLLLRNLILAADLFQNHIRHFYLLGLADWAELPKEPPLTPGPQFTPRLSKTENARLAQSYLQSFDVSQKTHALLVVFGARAPHQQDNWPGGVTLTPTIETIDQGWALMSDVYAFITERMVPDVEILSRAYSDYYSIGSNKTNLLSYGMFRKPGNRGESYYPSGAVVNGQQEEVQEDAISEGAAARPAGQPEWLEHAYGWQKVPRYRGEVMQGGPIARLWLSGDYRRGTGTLDRIITRVLETKRIAEWAFDWLKALQPGTPAYKAPTVRGWAKGRGLHDSMRGPLGHWVSIERHRIESYRVITPSTWNMAPRGEDKQYGPIEVALIGSPVEDPEHPVEVGRIVRSFDPCSACAVHVINADGDLKEYRV